METLLLQTLALQHNPWHARMHMAVNTAVGASVTIPFDTVDYDPGSSLTTGVGAKYTVPVDGYYFVTCGLQQSTNAAIFFEIQKNAVNQVQSAYYATGVVNTQILGSGTIKCVAGDLLTVLAGNAFTTSSGINLVYAEFIFLRPA